MSLRIVNLALIDNETIMVEFSDGTFATFTVKELASLKRFRGTPDPNDPPNMPN
jgi:hypothetical protein